MNDSHIIKNAFVKQTVQDGEMILLNPETGEYFGLNESGNAIWETLDTASTVNTIVRHVALVYDSDERAIEPIVRKFLESLRERRLVMWAP